MYEIVRGPLVWIAFIVFLGGCLYKVITMHALAKSENSVYPTMNVKFGFRSLFHWSVPFATKNMRMKWVVTILSFCFHFCLIVTPLFAAGHVLSVQESWGFGSGWWTFSAYSADVMTVLVIFTGLALFTRRLISPEVRNVNTYKDYLILLIVIAPYVTGFVAHQQWMAPHTMVIAHIVTGALWLIAIPFTWLSHMLWFVFSRMYMGSEFGAVRNARDW
jgi:nitrate reductase gamma subunit